jgi:hypothetical protein
MLQSALSQMDDYHDELEGQAKLVSEEVVVAPSFIIKGE